MRSWARKKNRLEGVNIYMGFGGGPLPPARKGPANGHVDVNSLFLGPAERTFIYKMGLARTHAGLQLSRTYDDRANVHPGDVIMMAATPPRRKRRDELRPHAHGHRPLPRRARDVIVQINENVPYVYGKDNMINIEDVTCAIDKTEELCVMPDSTPSELDNRIADLIAEPHPGRGLHPVRHRRIGHRHGLPAARRSAILASTRSSSWSRWST